MILEFIDSLRSSAKPTLLVVSVGLTLTGGAPVWAQTAIVIEGGDTTVLNDVASSFAQFRTPVTIEQTSRYDLLDKIRYSADALVVLQSYDTPNLRAMNETLEIMAEQGRPSTYMVFVDSADNYDWTSQLGQPSNVKISIAVRSQDQAAIADVYGSIGSEYDGSRMGYDYSHAVRMAVEQLSAIGQNESGGSKIKPWAAERSDLFFDSNVLYSGAPQQDAEELMGHFSTHHSSSELDWAQAHGVHGGEILFDTTPGDMPLIWAETVLGECSGSERWDGMIKNQVSFQSFGTIGLQ